MRLPEEPDTAELLNLSAAGDQQATHQLLARYRPKLRQMVALRMNRKLAGRVDASDIVQEALTEAATRIGDYAQTRPIAFYPWLRQFAWNRLIDAYREHVLAQRRSVDREQSLHPLLSDESATHLAEQLFESEAGPDQQLVERERKERVEDLLTQLPDQDRELIVLRYVEQLSLAEIAEVLGITTAAVKMRQLRLLQRLQKTLGKEI